MKGDKGYSGQSQLLIPLIIVLGSVLALAANTTMNASNSTNDSIITGNIIEMPIENMLNTVISLEVKENLVRATLTLNNGTLLDNKQIDFYLNNTLLGSGLTNAEGFVDFPVSDNGTIKAVFLGDASSFLNSSENEIIKGSFTSFEDLLSKSLAVFKESEPSCGASVKNVIPFDTNAPIGSTHIEDLGSAWHIWNSIKDYYVDKGGIQLTNNFNDYWTENLWCFWTKDPLKKLKKLCSDEMNWTWNYGTDNQTYADLNGTATYKEGRFSALFKVRYYLADGYGAINISLGFENTGKDIEDLNYGWVVRDIKINGKENNVIDLLTNDGPLTFDLSNESLDLEYNESELNERHYKLRNVNGGSIDFWWDGYVFKDDSEYGLNYKLKVNHDLFKKQYNAPVALLVNIGNFSNNSKAYTNFWWVDADNWLGNCDMIDTGCNCSSGPTCPENDPNLCPETGSGGANTCAGTCPARSHTMSTPTCYIVYSGCKACVATKCQGNNTNGCTCSGTSGCSYICDTNWHSDDGDTSDGCENAAPQWSNPVSANSTTPNQGDAVNFSAVWQDNTGDALKGLGLNYTWLYWNGTNGCSGSWENINYSSHSNTASSTTVSKIFNIPSGCAGKAIGLYIYANDSANRQNNTNLYTISVSTGFSYSNNQVNTTVAGTPANFTLSWTDAIQLAGYIFSTNNTGTWANSSYVSFSGTTNTSWNVTTLNSTIGTVVAWCFYANDTSGIMNGTSCLNDNNRFFLKTGIGDTTGVPFYPNQRSICRDITGRIHVAWLYNSSLVRYANSSDGLTWTSKDINNTATTKGQPSISCDGNNVYIAYNDQTDSNISAYKSTNNGGTFTRLYINISPETSAVPQIEARGNNIYVLYSSGSQYVFLTASTNGGVSWGNTLAINVGNNKPDYVSMAVNGTGGSNDTIYAMGTNVPGACGDKVVFSRSNNSGSSFGIAGSIIFSGGTSSPCLEYPSITYSGSNVYVTARDSIENRVWFINSTDGGVTWGPNSTINTTVSGTKQYAAVTIDNSSYPMVFWEQNSQNSNYDIVYRKHNGTQWLPDSNVYNITNDNLGNEYVNAKYSKSYGKMDFLWRSGTGSPYSIQYSSLTLDNANPYIVNQQSFINWIVNGYNISANASDPDGLANITNCTVIHSSFVESSTPCFLNTNCKLGVYDNTNGNCSTNISTSDQNQIVWSNDATTTTISTHSIVANETEGYIYVVDNVGVVYKINATNGTVAASNDVSTSTSAGGLSQDDKFLYFTNNGGTLVKVNKTNLTDYSESTRVIVVAGLSTTTDADWAYIGGGWNLNLTKVNKTSFAVNWSTQMITGAANYIRDLDNNISSDWLYSCYSTSSSTGNVSRINKTNGAADWNASLNDTSNKKMCSAIILDTYSGNIWAGSNNDTLYQLNESNGAFLNGIYLGTSGKYIYDIAVDNNYVYTFDDDGNVRKINKTNLSDIKWNFTMSAEDWYGGDGDTNYLYTYDYNHGEVLKLYKSGLANYTVNERVCSKIRFTDYAGAYADTTTDCNGILDEIPPIVTVQSPVNNTIYHNSTIWFNVTLDDAGSKCLVNISNTNQTLTNSSGNWNYLNNTLADGTYWTRFYCNDTFGNMNSSVYINFTIDTTPPTYSLNSTNYTSSATVVQHSLNWTTNTDLSGYIFQFCNGTWNGTICLSASCTYTITLNESNGGNVGDMYVRQDSPYNTYNYGTGTSLTVASTYDNLNQRVFMLWNLSAIPAGSTITNANLSLYAWGVPSSRYHLAYNTSPYNTTGTTSWNEGTLSNSDCGSGVNCNRDHNMTWDNQPSAGTLQDNISIGTTSNVWKYFNVTNATIYSYSAGQNMSIMIRDNVESDVSIYYVYYYSKEYATASQRPQLVITYMAPSCGWVNDTWDSTNFNGLTAWSNVTKVVNSIIGTTIAWCVYANDSFNNWNGTSCQNPFSYTITDTTPPTYTNNVSTLVSVYSPTNYSNFSITWDDNSGSVNAYLENNFSGTPTNSSMSSYPNFVYNSSPLAAGVYQYRLVANDSSGNANATPILYFTIAQAPTSATIWLNSTIANITSTYPNSTINATAVSNVSGLYVRLWRNGTLIDNATSTSWNVTQWAAYPNNFSASVLGNQNYSSSALVFLWFNVSKGPTSVRLFLNDTENNKNYTNGTVANFTTIVNITGKTVYLTSNYTGWLLQSGTTSKINTTTLSTPGLFWNLTGYFDADENYTASSQYYYFNVTSVSFNVTLPNNINYTSSVSGSSTADEEINSTGPNDKNVTVWVKTTNYRQNSTVIGDLTNVSNFIINNTGNIEENITLCINQTMSKIALFGTKTANPYDSPQTIPACSAGAWIANSSLPIGKTDNIWIWTNFTGVIYPDDSAVRELYINSTQSGA